MRRFRDILTFIALGPIWLPLLLIVGLTLSVMSTALFLTPLATLPGNESPRKEASDRSWVAQADAILATLSNLDLKPVNTATLEPSKDVRLAEELLWKLWLTTGMPPLLRGDVPSPFDAYTRTNAVAYRQYIAKHQHLGFDELQRIGLANAIDAFGSPLWYMTLKYLAERVNATSDWRIQIHTLPTLLIVEAPLSDEAYKRLSTELSRWLENNDKELVWNADEGKFRPRHGKYIGTDALYEACLKDRRSVRRDTALDAVRADH